MTRSEACEILGIPENSSITVAKAAFKILRQEATTEVHGKVLATAFNVFQGVLKDENDDIEIEPVKPAPRPTPRKTAKKPTPYTPTTRKPAQRNLKAKSSEVAKQSATGVTEPANDIFQREDPLPESAFQHLSELQASRTYQSYETRALGLLKYHTGPSAENWDVALAPDERTFLLASASWVYKWDINSGKLIKGASKVGLRWEAHSFSDTYGCDISSDGSRALTANHSGEVFLWDYHSGTVLKKLELGGSPRKVRFVLGDRKAIRVGWDGKIVLWDLDTGHHDILASSIGRTSGLAVSQDGKRAFITERTLSIKAWDLEAKKKLWFTEPTTSSSGFESLAVSADETLGVVSLPVGLFWFDLTRKKVIQEYGHSTWPTFGPQAGAAISNDGKKALTSSMNDIVLWDLPTRRPVKRLKGHTKPPTAIRFSRNGSFALSASHDATVKLWRF